MIPEGCTVTIRKWDEKYEHSFGYFLVEIHLPHVDFTGFVARGISDELPRELGRMWDYMDHSLIVESRTGHYFQVREDTRTIILDEMFTFDDEDWQLDHTRYATEPSLRDWLRMATLVREILRVNEESAEYRTPLNDNEDIREKIFS